VQHTVHPHAPHSTCTLDLQYFALYSFVFVLLCIETKLINVFCCLCDRNQAETLNVFVLCKLNVHLTMEISDAFHIQIFYLTEGNTYSVVEFIYILL